MSWIALNTFGQTHPALLFDNAAMIDLEANVGGRQRSAVSAYTMYLLAIRNGVIVASVHGIVGCQFDDVARSS